MERFYLPKTTRQWRFITRVIESIYKECSAKIEKRKLISQPTELNCKLISITFAIDLIDLLINETLKQLIQWSWQLITELFICIKKTHRLFNEF